MFCLNKQTLLIIAGTIVLLTVGIPVLYVGAPGYCMYCPVDAQVSSWPSASSVCITIRDTHAPNYLLKQGRLYLRVEKVRHLVLLSQVSFDDWNRETITGFRESHPELEQYWPSPTDKLGGVLWFGEK
jgi:hypothetical protein